MSPFASLAPSTPNQGNGSDNLSLTGPLCRVDETADLQALTRGQARIRYTQDKTNLNSAPEPPNQDNVQVAPDKSHTPIRGLLVISPCSLHPALEEYPPHRAGGGKSGPRLVPEGGTSPALQSVAMLGDWRAMSLLPLILFPQHQGSAEARLKGQIRFTSSSGCSSFNLLASNIPPSLDSDDLVGPGQGLLFYPP